MAAIVAHCAQLMAASFQKQGIVRLLSISDFKFVTTTQNYLMVLPGIAPPSRWLLSRHISTGLMPLLEKAVLWFCGPVIASGSTLTFRRVICQLSSFLKRAV